MTNITLFCLVDGDSTSKTFYVEIDRTKTVNYLKKLIKAENANNFHDIDSNDLTLWLVQNLESKPGSLIMLDALETKEELDNPRTPLSKFFPGSSADDNTFIMVRRPPPAPKRDREDNEGASSKRKRLDMYTLMDAIEAAGLSEKAVVDGRSDLSRLDKKERVSLLDFIGQAIDRTDIFDSLSSTALELQGANIRDRDRLSAPRDAVLPVVETNDLYVRECFKALYDSILRTFEDSRPHDPDVRKHVVVTGTSGIGKSAFLVYFAIRLLAESDIDNPPMIIFHTKRSERCFVFGGCSTIRSGNIEDFMPFLSLSDTWYLVYSSFDTVLARAKTIISASPKTLSSEAQPYQDVDKRVSWRYYMTHGIWRN